MGQGSIVAVTKHYLSKAASAVEKRFDTLRHPQTPPFKIPPSQAVRPVKPSPAIAVPHAIDIFWCDRHGVYLQGWAHCNQTPVTGVTLWQGDTSFRIPEMRPRLDLLRFFPDLPDAEHTGFAGYVEGPPGGDIRLEVHTATRSFVFTPDLPRAGVLDSPWTDHLLEYATPSTQAFQVVIDEINDRNGVIAEIGARVVGEESHAMHPLFPKAKRYIGIDIHAGPGVDRVGDAHRLDELVGESAVDAVISFSVMEHLSHPWLFAAANNRALRIGGLAYHSAPQTWPLHEAPNDFWRLSDEGLKVLFGPETGFEVLVAGMNNRMDIYPEERRGAFVMMPVNPGYGNAFILARKVRHLQAGAVTWPIARGTSERRSSRYPNRTA